MKTYQVQFRAGRGSILTRTVEANSPEHAESKIFVQQRNCHNYVSQIIQTKEVKNNGKK